MVFPYFVRMFASPIYDMLNNMEDYNVFTQDNANIFTYEVDVNMSPCCSHQHLPGRRISVLAGLGDEWPGNVKLKP